MPADSPPGKLAATRGYGAEVIEFDRYAADREALLAELVAERGLVPIHPYDDERVMAGQGTVALELLEQAGPLDVLLVCVGGGGLIAGCATAAEALAPRIRVIGVEPEAGDDTLRSLAAGERVRIEVPRTIADGQQLPTPGELTFPVIQELRRRDRARLRRRDRRRDAAAVRAPEDRRRAERGVRARRAAGRPGRVRGPARRRDDLGRQRHGRRGSRSCWPRPGSLGAMAWNVLILGGGFGGLYAARKLERLLPPHSARITLVNDVNFMLYTPLLPGAAGGTLEPRHVVVPLREELKRTRSTSGTCLGADPARTRCRSAARRARADARLRPAGRRARLDLADAADPGPGRARARLQDALRGDRAAQPPHPRRSSPPSPSRTTRRAPRC